MPVAERSSDTKRNTQRVQIDLPSRSMSRLKDLKDLTEASSYTEVVKEALRLYEDTIARADRGETFFVKDKDGNLSQYPIFGA